MDHTSSTIHVLYLVRERVTGDLNILALSSLHLLAAAYKAPLVAPPLITQAELQGGEGTQKHHTRRWSDAAANGKDQFKDNAGWPSYVPTQRLRIPKNCVVG